MAKRRKAKLRSATIGATRFTPIKVDIREFDDEIEDATHVVLRAYIRPNANHGGYWGETIHKGRFDALPAGLEYIPKEKGLHTLVLMTADRGVAYTFRSAPIRVT